jgi:3-oxoacyl-[acyl-carrier protein] reductase
MLRPKPASKSSRRILPRRRDPTAGANCIAPETILTERNKERIPAAQQNALCELHPIRRLGTPDDVALAALYLASDDASWVAGVIFDVAGGAVMV